MVSGPTHSTSGSTEGKVGYRLGCALVAVGIISSVILSFLVAIVWMGIEEQRIQRTGFSRPGSNMVIFNIIFNVVLSAVLGALFCPIGARVGQGIARNAKKGVKGGVLVSVVLSVAVPWGVFLTGLNPPTEREPGSFRSVCFATQETWEQIDDYMSDYQQAHEAQNDERKAELRQMVKDTLPDCAAPAAAVTNWLYGVDKDDQERMATAEARYRQEIRD